MKLNITQEQYVALRQAGVPRDKIVAEYGSKQSGQRVLDAATKVTDALGLGGAVDTIGSNLATLRDPRAALEGRIDTPSLKQNIGAGLQIGTITAGGAPGAATKAVLPAVKLGATLGGASAGGAAMAEDKPTGEVLKDAAIGGVVGGAVTGAFALAGRLLERTGDKIQYSVIKPTKADIDDGFSIDTVKRYNLGGSLNQVFKKTESRMDELTTQLNTKLAQSNNVVDFAEVLSATEAKLSKDKLASFGSNTSIQSALTQLKSELADVGTDLTIPEAQVVKRAAGHYGAWQYGMFDPDSTARQRVYNTFYNQLKEQIEAKSPPGIKAINKELSELIPVINAVIRRIPIAERNNALSLTDVIGLVGSAISPQALGFTLLNFMSKSGTVANALSKIGQATPGAAPATNLPATVLPTALLSGDTRSETQ